MADRTYRTKGVLGVFWKYSVSLVWRHKRDNSFRIMFRRCLKSHLVCFLVEVSRHFQQRTPLVESSGERFPLLLQLTGDLLDLLRRIMTPLQKPVPHRHDPADVHIHVLQKINTCITSWRDVPNTNGCLLPIHNIHIKYLKAVHIIY